MASNVYTATATATATAKTPLLQSNSRRHSSSRLCVSHNNFNSFSTHSNSSYHSNLRLTTLHHRRPLVLLRNPIPHSSHSQSPSHYHSHPQSQSQSQSNSGSSSSSSAFEQWDSLTAKFAGASNIPFLLLQLPQIILNARNLLAGNNSALFAVPWLGMLTGVLGNLSLLSYFAKKREKEVIVVQTLGVVSQYIVFSQLAIAGAMPFSFFLITSAVVSAGLLVNFLNYFYLLKPSLWLLWEDFITIGGLSALPQVMWSTFVPYLPNTVLPGAFAFLAALTAVIMARTGKLSEKGTNFVGAISGWTATLLFMWMPVSQMWTNFLNPNNIKGLSAFSMLLAMIGNGLMIPRALLIRDFMWCLGSSWASLFYGYGNIVCLYWFNSISSEFFLAASAGLFLWIGMALWRDTVVYGHSSPLTSLRELVFGAQV